MKRLIVLAVLAAITIAVYRWVSRSGPVRAYEKFADAWARDETAEALKHSDGEPVKKLFETKSIRGVVDARMIEAIHGVRDEIESVARMGEGEVALTARQLIAFDPPGATTGIGGAMIASFRHEAKLRKTEDGWKVVSFEPSFLAMTERRRR